MINTPFMAGGIVLLTLGLSGYGPEPRYRVAPIVVGLALIIIPLVFPALVS